MRRFIVVETRAWCNVTRSRIRYRCAVIRTRAYTHNDHRNNNCNNAHYCGYRMVVCDRTARRTRSICGTDQLWNTRGEKNERKPYQKILLYRCDTRFCGKPIVSDRVSSPPPAVLTSRMLTASTAHCGCTRCERRVIIIINYAQKYRERNRTPMVRDDKIVVRDDTGARLGPLWSELYTPPTTSTRTI
jgi:hypothetical protein